MNFEEGKDSILEHTPTMFGRIGSNLRPPNCAYTIHFKLPSEKTIFSLSTI